MIDKTLVSRFKKKKSEAKFTTGMGIMNTNKQVNIYFTLLEFYEKKIINWKANVFKNHTRYDMIVGRDLLQALKINFEHETIYWEEAFIPMKSIDSNKQEMFIQDSKAVEDETQRIRKILEAKYEAADLDEIVKSCINLTKVEQKNLLTVLKKHASLFNGTLGKWQGEKLDIEFKTRC
jgi:hypothetical protein